ncbi:MAG: hypothetical protein LBM60_09125 [Clostridium sp.]|jgi:hypothetical protein|nr:hypothetical protein [Clostridium sp.]
MNPVDDKSKRNLIILLQEICSEEGIRLSCFSQDWILRLEREGLFFFVFGYKFPLNHAVASMLCDDKSATSQILADAQIAHVEHQLILSPVSFEAYSIAPFFEKLAAYQKRHGAVVIKPNQGTGGLDVTLAKDPSHFEQYVTTLLSRYPSIAISPYYEITMEYRAILLHGEVKILYEKHRPCIIGDGQSTVWELLQADATLADFTDHLPKAERNRVLHLGERYDLNWKFNLGLGAKPVLLLPQNESQYDIDLLSQSVILNEVTLLAQRTVAALDITLAAVDIIQTAEGLMVLEVNSGIMMEAFSSIREYRHLAKELYREIIHESFSMKEQSAL